MKSPGEQPSLIPFNQHRMGLWVRVSSKNQRDKGNSLEAQDWQNRRFFEHHCLEWPPDQFIFQAVGSAYDDENILRLPEFQGLLDALFTGQLAGFYTFKFNRGFRNVIDAAEVYKRLQKAGKKAIQTVNLDDPYDIFTVSGRDRFFDEIIAAQKQSSQSSAAIRVGKAFRAAKGLSNATIPLLAVRRLPDGSDEWSDDAPVIRRMGELMATGLYSCRDVAEMVSTTDQRFSPNQVYKLLRSPYLRGHVRHTSISLGKRWPTKADYDKAGWYPSQLGPLWTPETMAAIDQAMTARHVAGRGAHGARKALVFGNRLMRCARCGGTMYGRADKKRTARTDARRAIYLCRNGSLNHTCAVHSQTMPETLLFYQIKCLLSFLVMPADWVEQQMERVKAEKGGVDQVATLRRQVDAQIKQAALEMATNPTDAAIRQFQITKRELEAQLKTVQVDQGGGLETRLNQMVQLVQGMQDAWLIASKTEQRRLITHLFGRLVIDLETRAIVQVMPARDDVAMLFRACEELSETDTPGVFDVVIDLQQRIPRTYAHYALMTLGPLTMAGIRAWLGRGDIKDAVRGQVRALARAGIIQADKSQRPIVYHYVT